VRILDDKKACKEVLMVGQWLRRWWPGVPTLLDDKKARGSEERGGHGDTDGDDERDRTREKRQDTGDLPR
jgi:hypothetical protein